MPRVAQRDRRGASDEVVCVLADAFGFESADNYGCANEATLPRLRAQARRARALEKVNAFVSRRGLAFSPPISPPISPPAISEQQVQVDNEVLDWPQRRLDSVQRILSHARLHSTHGASFTATSPAGLAQCRNAADRARRVVVQGQHRVVSPCARDWQRAQEQGLQQVEEDAAASKRNGDGAGAFFS